MNLIAHKAAEHGAEVYGQMLDLENAHIEDAVHTGMLAAASEALRLDHRAVKALREAAEKASRERSAADSYDILADAVWSLIDAYDGTE